MDKIIDEALFKKYTGQLFPEYRFEEYHGSKTSRHYDLGTPNVVKLGNVSVEKFFQVVLPELLKRKKISCQDYIKTIDGFILSDKTTLPRSYPPEFLKNIANSCAIDSLLFIIFFAGGSFFMDKICSSQTSETDVGKRLKTQILPLLKDLYTRQDKWTGNAMTIQRALFPFIEARSCSDVKSGTEIWSLLANAFMDLQFDYVSVYKRGLGNKPIKYVYLDFKMDPPTKYLDADFLIYGDDNVPVTQNLLPVHDLQVDDYKLIAVLFFKGMAHYTSAISTPSGWVYYDDVSGRVVGIKNPREYIFNESPSHKIQMLFYKRIK